MGKDCDGYDDLIFGVRRSSRYHTKRRQYFENMSRFIKIVTAFTGIGTFATMLSETIGLYWTLAFSSFVALFSTIDLVVGTSEMARLHSDLARRFITLEKQLVKAGNEIEESALNDFIAQRLEIEIEEPPKLGILDIICHNELVKAMGYGDDEQVKLNFFQRRFSHYCDIGLHHACKNNQAQTASE